MLLRFRVRNHRSIRDEEEISLVASNLDDNDNGLILCDATGGQKVLPAVVVYGANASGKSNLVSAIEELSFNVRESCRRTKPDAGVNRKPFAFNTESNTTTSRHDIDFVLDGIRYHYGYEANNMIFLAEWLYTYPVGVRRTLFERRGQGFKFGRGLKGHNKIIAETTRANSLFISTAAQMNHRELSAITQYISELGCIKPSTANTLFSLSADPMGEDERIIEFLHEIGTGISNIFIDFKEMTSSDKRRLSSLIASVEENYNDGVPDELRNMDVKPAFQFVHKAKEGGEFILDFNEESEGTRRLLHILIAVYKALDNGTPVIIDELNAHLHTQACEAVLALFCDPKTNPKGAQLIATTHDTNLLRSEYLRRDQVWFAEKDREGATHIYPLTDIRTRKGDNIEKGYLQGRYGAVPFSGPVSRLTKG